MLALGGLRRQMLRAVDRSASSRWSATACRPTQIKRLQRQAAPSPTPFARAQTPGHGCRAASRGSAEAGVRVGVGTDGGGQQGDQFIGWTMHTELENMVAAGMSPAQVLVAATRTSARHSQASTILAWSHPARAPTSWCSTPIRSTTSPTRADRARLPVRAGSSAPGDAFQMAGGVRQHRHGKIDASRERYFLSLVRNAISALTSFLSPSKSRATCS